MDPRALRLMVVTSGAPGPAHGHRGVVSAALDGGATAVQLRAPELGERGLLRLAEDLALLCRSRGVLFIVNDRLDIAIESGADGVHLGQSDLLAGSRDRLGPDRILGVSVSDSEQARTAESMGADYLGVTVWASPTKPEAIGRGPGGLREICEAVPIPVVGIGGIDRHNLSLVFDAGASGIAVISAVAGASDPTAAARDLRMLIDQRKA